MLGLISTIIAIVKKHYTFAAVVGIWTAVAWALYLTGAFEYVYAPGLVFLYIALFNLKSPEAEAKQRAEKQLKSKELKRIFYCKKCGKMVEGFSTQARETCPSCQIGMMKTDFPCSLWDQMTDSEKEKQKSLWADGKKEKDPELIKELRARRDRKEASFLSDNSSEKSEGPENVPVVMPVSNSHSQSSVPVQKFCRKCGKRLKPGAKFCNECGTQVVASDNTLPRETQASDSFLCPYCGFVMESRKKYCPECGVLLKSPSVAKESELSSEKSVVNVIPVDNQTVIGGQIALNLSALPPKLRRAFVFIEDEEWDRADEYLEPILDEEPENPYANLGKAMIKVKVDSPFDLTDEEISSIINTRAYRRAKKYADASLMSLFENWERKQV